MELLIAVIIGFLVWLIASSKKGTSIHKSDAVRLTPLVTTLPIDAAMDAVIEFARHNRYTIDTNDRENFRIVLNESASGFSWGSFFPIHFSVRSDGKTIVEIGIRGKVSQREFSLNKNHERCVNGIRDYLTALE